MRWVWLRFRLLCEVVHSPETAFARDLTGPSYLVPLCFLGLVALGITAIQLPMQLEWLRFQLDAAGAPAAHAAASLERVRGTAGISLSLAPVLLVLRCSILALMLWLTTGLFLLEVGFARMLGIVAYSYLAIMGRDAVILLIVFLRGSAALQSSEGLNVAIGLNLMFPSLALPWSALAANINIFEAWFVMLLVIGIAGAAGIRWSRALAIVLPTWIIAVLTQFGFVLLGLAMKGSV